MMMISKLRSNSWRNLSLLWFIVLQEAEVAAVWILVEQGFMEVYNLEGGLYGWQNEGLPVTQALMI